MSEDNPYTSTYFGDRPVEVIRSSNGDAVAEIVKNENEFQVWKKAPVTFPPTRRHTLLASFETLAEALDQAPALIETPSEVD